MMLNQLSIPPKLADLPDISMERPGSPIEVGRGVSNAVDAYQAGARAARDALATISGNPLSAILVFASAHLDLLAALRAVHDVAGDVPVLGATTAGEISDRLHRDSIVVLALASPHLSVRCAIGGSVSRNWQAAIEQAIAQPEIAAYFSGGPEPWLRLAREGKAAFAIVYCPGNTRESDARCFEMLEVIKIRSLGRMPVLLGAAGDNWKMEQSHVLLGREACPDSVLLAVFETELQFGMGLAHGFGPAAQRTTVTAVEDHEVLTFDGEPAASVFARLVGTSGAALEGKHLTLATGHPFGTPDPMGQFSVNAPSYVTPRGGIRFTQPLSSGAVLTLMEPDGEAMLRAGPEAVRKAILRGGITEPAVTLVNYCALRPLLLGEADAAREISAISDLIGGAPLVGFHSFGEGGVADDGVSRFSNAAVAALVLGHALSPAAQAARENEKLQEQLNLHARLLEERVEQRTHELQRRDAILSSIAQCATELLGAAELGSTLGRVLELLGKAVGADAVWVMKSEAGRGGRVATICDEWVAPDVPPHLAGLPHESIDLETLGFDKVQQGPHQSDPVYLVRSDVQGRLREVFDRLDLRSLLLVPVFAGAHLWGLVGLVHVRVERWWTNLETDAMRMLAAMVGGAIEREAAERKIAALARTDSLTGLANRATFQERLGEVYAAARRGAGPFAVHYLDLDYFKRVNDTLGHGVGDELLKSVASRLAANTRATDLAARLGGDEFAILQTEVSGPSAAGILAAKIQSALEAPHAIEGADLFISASIGITLWRPETQAAEQLLTLADRALYRAKAEGRAQYRFAPDLE